MRISPISNHWGDVVGIPVEMERSIVFRGREGAAYNHHPQITSLNGRLFVTWSNGEINEDDVGQRMLMATSDDGGDTWCDPRPVVPRQPGEYADAVVTSAGIRVHDDTLVAYYGYFEFTEAGLCDGHRQPAGMGQAPENERWHQNTRCGAYISEDGGESWRHSGIVVDHFVPNWSPYPTRSGRLIMTGNLCFPYTDDPRGVDGWIRTGLPRLPEGYVDDSEGHHRGCRHRGDEVGYCEGSFYQMEDGVLRMMLRTGGYRLAVSESRDDGETWSEPMPTRYTDGRSKHLFGKLPDGRFFGLSTPAPRPGRTPLILALSEDGNVFDRHYVLGNAAAGSPRTKGNHKGGVYGYPHFHVVNGIGHVVYSIYKEDIAVIRFDLDELA